MSALRVAFVAGTLGRGGAERQLLHMVAALTEAGVEARVYSMTRGDLHEASLEQVGVKPVWVGQSSLPAVRTVALTAALIPFRPHVVQASHFFVNLYVTASAVAHGATAIGAIRSDLEYELQTLGRWARPLLMAPPDLITNSQCAHRAAVARGRRISTVHVVPNVIALSDFDRTAGEAGVDQAPGPGVVAIAVGSLLPVKRLDRFLTALALARRRNPGLRGLIVGDGPERGRLETLAASLGLGPAEAHFTGPRDDIPALLASAAFLVLTSDHEGFPNAVLEAMAARRPVLATSCGDVEQLVRDGVGGFIVPPDDHRVLADRMFRLAADAELRQRLGAGARREAELHDRSTLAGRILDTYQTISARRADRRLAGALS